MTKQEEIRDGINQQIELAILGVVVNALSNPNGDYGLLIQEARREIVKYEDSQGVVIKVDRDLPSTEGVIFGPEGDDGIWGESQ